MNMYATPVEGIYTIKTPDFQGGFFIEKVKVKVLGETAKSLLIKLSCAVGNHRGGDCMTVRRRNVKMPQGMSMSSGIGPKDKPVRQYDYSGAFWNQ